MEPTQERPILTEEQILIEAAFAEKKGRDIYAQNPYTCYISISSPTPDLPSLTVSMLEELERQKDKARIWTSRWDKSIISIAPGGSTGCDLLSNEDIKGKSFIPVTTTKRIDGQQLLKKLSEGSLGFIGINDQPMTVDAFLICYFHMVNELIWDTAIEIQGEEKVDQKSYALALEKVLESGFSAGLISKDDIFAARKQNPKTSLRIYGSNTNHYVPKIMGAIIRP